MHSFKPADQKNLSKKCCYSYHSNNEIQNNYSIEKKSAKTRIVLLNPPKTLCGTLFLADISEGFPSCKV